MYVEIVTNRNSRPARLLREGVCEAGRVCKRTLANLTDWPAEKVRRRRPLGPVPVSAHRANTDSASRRTPHRNVPGAGDFRLENPNPNNQLSLVLPGELWDRSLSWDREARP